MLTKEGDFTVDPSRSTLDVKGTYSTDNLKHETSLILNDDGTYMIDNINSRYTYRGNYITEKGTGEFTPSDAGEKYDVIGRITLGNDNNKFFYILESGELINYCGCWDKNPDTPVEIFESTPDVPVPDVAGIYSTGLLSRDNWGCSFDRFEFKGDGTYAKVLYTSGDWRDPYPIRITNGSYTVESGIGEFRLQANSTKHTIIGRVSLDYGQFFYVTEEGTLVDHYSGLNKEGSFNADPVQSPLDVTGTYRNRSWEFWLELKDNGVYTFENSDNMTFDGTYTIERGTGEFGPTPKSTNSNIVGRVIFDNDYNKFFYVLENGDFINYSGFWLKDSLEDNP